ncbi:MAG: dephospho-CoA kinase [Acidimicrobiaceae bacterium]|nr:dephospho-CoA kinase [Acidimicrobiaceae bacterium]MYC42395.1 dephospho-CoA kinase [Acidimicrobiaceae bacterium]MYH88944.1 dephospho-CoA kinase [Acidimicrobiaceae bacterium]
MIEIALTGGMGSGKSTVADAFVARGAELIDADRIVRELQEPGQPVFEAMVQRWGTAVVAEDGTLNRGAVAEIAFNDDDELKALGEIVHPALYNEIERRRGLLAGSDAVVVLDLPLLVGADGTSIADQFGELAGIVVVDADTETTVERLVAGRGFDEADARTRIANQASREARIAIADWVIDNSGDLTALERNIDNAWEWITSLPHTSAS